MNAAPITDDQFGGHTSSARSLLTTMMGEYVVPNGGRVWTATIIDGLATLDISERNARQAVARLAQREVVVSERVGRRARWCITKRGTQYLTAGAQRIYRFGEYDETWDEIWSVVVCSIPERQRSTRNRLRSLLTFAGFGFIESNVAICPHAEQAEVAQQILDELGLGHYTIMTGSMLSHATPADAWDLDALAVDYATFVERFEKLDPVGGASMFAATLQLVDEWRRFPFRDPELPLALLPDSWPGIAARATFERRRAEWAESSRAWYQYAEANNAT